MTRKKKLWLGGLVLAGIGVAMARLVSGRFGEPVTQLVLYGCGVIIALAGLGMIMAGMKKT